MNTNNAYCPIFTLILPLLLLTVGCGTMDPEVPEESSGAFSISFNLFATSPTTLEGTFLAFGAIDDRGACVEVLASAESISELSNLEGKKTLQGSKGDIEIEFYIRLNSTAQNSIQATGRFKIVKGTGVYARLRGEGEIDIEVDRDVSSATLTKTFEGRAWYGQ